LCCDTSGSGSFNSSTSDPLLSINYTGSSDSTSHSEQLSACSSICCMGNHTKQIGH
jgi:hypothetical protein